MTAIRKGTYRALKRCFDIVGAAAGIAFLWPAGLLIALFIKLTDGGPVFFQQARVGRFGAPFRIWKFRTMVVDAEQHGLPLTGGADARVTRIGCFLRRTKVDELPQLWNVLRGEMSLVGPRPEVPRYVEQYTEQQREILNYKPGITDLASVLFRNEEALLRGAGDVEQLYLSCCLPKKIELNRQYAQRATLWRDAGIILQTLFPYWLGVAALYGIGLATSLLLSYQLHRDFQMTHSDYAELWRCMPWIVLPQLAALGGLAQLRGLVSYFSLLELHRNAIAAAMAFAAHLMVWRFSGGWLAPSPSLLLLDGLLSLSVLCAIRLVSQFVRERGPTGAGRRDAGPKRIAIIGAGEAATRMALNLTEHRNGSKRVVAFFDDDPRRWHRRPHDIPIVGMPECLLNPEWRNNIDEVVVALSEVDPPRLGQIWRMLKSASLRVTFAFP